jgi:hypothetical protein
MDNKTYPCGTPKCPNDAGPDYYYCAECRGYYKDMTEKPLENNPTAHKFIFLFVMIAIVLVGGFLYEVLVALWKDLTHQ